MTIRELFDKYPSHHVSLLDQRIFRQRFKRQLPVGLCAGLVQVWWAQHRKGANAVACLQKATPAVIQTIVLCQARSLYLRVLADSEEKLNPRERRLLNFKYGTTALVELDDLLKLFEVRNLLELDLVLQHGLPLVNRTQFRDLTLDVATTFSERMDSGLRLLVSRYGPASPGGRVSGHRCALAVESSGSCSFFDTTIGEVRFLSLEEFGVWFADFWAICCNKYAGRVLDRNIPAMQVFQFSGSLPALAKKKWQDLDERVLSVSIDMKDWI